MLRKIAIFMIIGIMILIAIRFMAPVIHSNGSHLYQIEVNYEVYTVSEIKIDSTLNRISFENLLGATITAPLDRAVITQIY